MIKSIIDWFKGLFKSNKKTRKYNRVTDAIKEDIIRLRKEGYDYETIALFVGVSSTSVGNVVRKHKEV